MNARFLAGCRTHASKWLLLSTALGLAACSDKAEVAVPEQTPSTEIMTRQGALEAPGTRSLVIDLDVNNTAQIAVSQLVAHVPNADPATFSLLAATTENGADISLAAEEVTYVGNPAQGWDRFSYQVCALDDATLCQTGVAHLVMRLGVCGGLQLEESFRSTTFGGSWHLGGDGYTAQLTAAGASPADPDGEGWLRLAPAIVKQSGYAFFDEKFPASNGVSMNFEVASWGVTNGQGGDGMLFFLVDGDLIDADNFTLGGCCGSLGYAPFQSSSITRAGMLHAVAGIAFDSWGGHWNNKEGRTGPDVLPPGAANYDTLLANNITVRSGAATNWKTIFVEQISKNALDLSCDTDGCQERPAELGEGRFWTTVTLTPKDGNSYFQMEIYVKASENGPYVRIVDADIPQPLPANLKLGLIGASGGGYRANHEVRNLSVHSVTDAQMQITSSVPDGESVADGDVVTYTYTINNKTSGPICAVDINLTLPEGFNVTSQSCVAQNPNDSCGNFATAGITSDVISLDGDGNVTITITGTVHHASQTPTADARGEATVTGTQGDSNPDDNSSTSTLNFKEPTLQDRAIDIIAGHSESFNVLDDVLDGDNIDYTSVVLSSLQPEPGVHIAYDETTGEITVTVDRDYTGPDTVTVTYTIANDEGTSPPATVTINITKAIGLVVDGSSDGEIWVEAGTPSVDFTLQGSEAIGTVTVLSTPTDSNNVPSGSTTVSGSTVTFTPDAGTENDPDSYLIEVEACALAEPTNCNDVLVTVVYNDAPEINATAGNQVQAPLDRTTSLPFQASPGEIGTLVPESLEIMSGQGCALSASGNAVEFTPAPGTAVGAQITCTLQVCEERPAGLCTTQDFVFTTIEGFFPTADIIDGAQGGTTTVAISTLTGNDGNADPDSFQLVGTPTGGSVSIVNGNVVFEADDDATEGAFTYQVCAAFDVNECSTVTVTVTLAEKPEGQNRTVWTSEAPVPGEVTVPSPFDNPATTDSSITSVTGGSATIGPNGEVLVTANVGHVGPVVVEVEGCTQTPVPACSTYTVTVVVNDAPEIVASAGDQAQAPPGRTTSLPFQASAGVVGTLVPASFEIVGGQASGCALSAAGNAVEFTPAAGTSEGTQVTCTLQICEELPAGLCTTQDFVFTTIQGFYPTAETINGAQGETSTVSITQLLSNDGNVDPDSFQLVGTPEGGSVSIVNGNVVFEADDDATEGSFTYTVCAAFDPTECSTVKVTVTLAEKPDGQNRTVWVLESTTPEEVTVPSPFDNPATTDSTVTSVTGGSAIIGPNGEVLVTPEDGHVGPVVVEVEGCTQTPVPACSTYTVTVVVNDLPTVADGSAIVTPGSTQSVSPDASAGQAGAINQASLTLLSSETTPNGTCGIDEANGKVTFTANADATLGATESCTFELCELAPVDACASAVITFEIQDIFNPTDDNSTTLEETELEIFTDALIGNDGNTDPSTFEIVGTPDTNGAYETAEGGLLTPNEDGDGFIYTPPAGFTGNDSFSYQICSGLDTNDCAVVTVTITVQQEVRITSPTDGEALEDSTPTVTGTAQPDTVITIIVDGTVVDTVIVDNDGNWEWTPDAPLDFGEHTIGAESDNGSTTEITITIEEPVAPRIPVKITSPDDASSTDNPRPTISGTGEPGAEITITVNGAPVGTVTVDENGQWSWTFENDLPPGDYVISATDEEGLSDSIDLTVNELDEIPDYDFAITEPTDGSSTEDPRPTLSGTGTPGSTVTITIDGEEVGTVTVDENGQWSWTPDFDLEPGTHTISAEDDLGNSASIDLIVTEAGGLDEEDDLDGVFTGGYLFGCASTGQNTSPVGLSLVALLIGGAMLRRRRQA